MKWHGPSPRHRLFFFAVLLLASCGGADRAETQRPNPARDRVAQALVAHASDAPWQLRYNPAACDCPKFEVRLAKRWLRAEWSNAGAARFAELMAKLAASPPEQWPFAMLVEGQIEGEIKRTVQGQYAVRIEVAKVLRGVSRAVPKPSEPPKPTAEPKPPEEPKETEENQKRE